MAFNIELQDGYESRVSALSSHVPFKPKFEKTKIHIPMGCSVVLDIIRKTPFAGINLYVYDHPEKPGQLARGRVVGLFHRGYLSFDEDTTYWEPSYSQDQIIPPIFLYGIKSILYKSNK